ncbi:hypothetical protein F4806DRAFT_461318 [Annulohypoxylon nitens]|nr:hypothetical protein F4806DRAFT_461318 [Annulohypoxylon nitens]
MRYQSLCIVAATLSSTSVVAAQKNTRFQNFFPVYRDALIAIRNDHCAALWAKQQIEPYTTVDGNCPALLSCILNNTEEATKGNFSSGLVALGIMPTLLTFLGSMVSETALLSKRRPLLALLIACGSPAVNPLPTFAYDNPLERLKAREGRLLPPRLLVLSPWQARGIVFVEYVLVLSAIANVMSASYYAGLWTINTISCDDTWYPIVWAGLTVVLHILGMIALDQRVRVTQTAGSTGGFRSGVLQWFRNEFTPCITQNKIELHWSGETYLFVFISWCSSISTVAHIFFGTIAFSSIIFIGYVDSIKIIFRFMASAVLCRAVLMFELAGMRNALVERCYEPIRHPRGTLTERGNVNIMAEL